MIDDIRIILVFKINSFKDVIVKIQLLLNSTSVYTQCILSRHKNIYEKTAAICYRIHSARIL